MIVIIIILGGQDILVNIITVMINTITFILIVITTILGIVIITLIMAILTSLTTRSDGTPLYKRTNSSPYRGRREADR